MAILLDSDQACTLQCDRCGASVTSPVGKGEDHTDVFGRLNAAGWRSVGDMFDPTLLCPDCPDEKEESDE